MGRPCLTRVELPVVFQAGQTPGKVASLSCSSVAHHAQPLGHHGVGSSGLAIGAFSPNAKARVNPSFPYCLPGEMGWSEPGKKGSPALP